MLKIEGSTSEVREQLTTMHYFCQEAKTSFDGCTILMGHNQWAAVRQINPDEWSIVTERDKYGRPTKFCNAEIELVIKDDYCLVHVPEKTLIAQIDAGVYPSIYDVVKTHLLIKGKLGHEKV